MQEIYDRLNNFSERMQLHYASPNNDLVVEIMQLDAGVLSSLTPQQLTQKTFEYHLNRTKFERTDVAGKTEKERNAWVLLNVPEIKELHDQVLAYEAEKMLMHGMVRSVEGLLNALKKEISGRFSD